MNSPRTLITLSVFLLLVSTVFGVLNSSKVKTLRAGIAAATAQKKTAERERATAEKNIDIREASMAEEVSKATETENHIATAEAELVKTQTEKADMLLKLQANEAQIADLQKHMIEMNKMPANPNPGAPSLAELQAQLDEARRQLDAAEEEKTLLAEKMQPSRMSLHGMDVASKPAERSFRGAIRGTVLVVNRAYNFVVLNLGERQGVEANVEMVVLRAGTAIGKIRISSVEPATAIGDIVGNSLARGVQVQPGDTVIYAGPNS
ncbi:MAG: hypothetical protein QOH24_1342 [Verrucomicrobiota bacterium]